MDMASLLENQMTKTLRPEANERQKAGNDQKRVTDDVAQAIP